jgi:hypothetical protein
MTLPTITRSTALTFHDYHGQYHHILMMRPNHNDPTLHKTF